MCRDEGDKGAAGKGNRRNLQLEIHVFTHRDHLQLLTELEQGENPIVFHAIDTDSFQDPNEEDPEHSEQRRKENEGILNGFREMQKRGSVELLVFNLFAYNVWNLAEHHGLPCLALASFPLSTISTPSGFSIMFSQEYPRFYDLLSNSRPPYLTKADLRSWMWKTFLDDAAEFRELMGASTLVPFEDIIVDIENEDSKELPMATRVVSTVSLELAKLVDRKLDLESLNVEYVGLFPPLPTPTSCESAISAFLESLDSTLKESDAPLILVYFGSMTRLSRHLLDSDSVLKLARTIEEASSGLSTPAKIVWIGEGPIAEALRPAGTLVVQLPPHFAFPALVSHLKQKHAKIVTITHGGSGTVQSLLQFGGIRQICVPLRFDQSKWADAVEELEAGKKVDVESSAEEWKKAMEDCLKLEPPTTVGGTGSGLEKALELVSELMASSFSVPKS